MERGKPSSQMFLETSRRIPGNIHGSETWDLNGLEQKQTNFLIQESGQNKTKPHSCIQHLR